MTKTQYNRLKKLINKLEDEVLEDGEDITSPEFQLIIDRLLKQKGFTLAEYQEHEIEPPKEPLELKGIAQIKGDKGVKGDTIKGDRGDKGDSITGSQGLPGKDGKDGKDGRTGKQGKPGKIIFRGKQGLQGLQGPPGKDIDITKLESKFTDLVSRVDAFSKNFEHNIDIISEAGKSMPDFRKLAMGLQEQIDALGNPLVIDLDSQCDGSNTTFNLGRIIRGVLFVNNNGGILTSSDYTVSSDKGSITLTYAPDSGEELEAVCLI